MTNEAAETEEAPTATEEEVIVVDEQDHEKETEEEDEDVFCPPVAAPPPPPPPTRTSSSSSSSSSSRSTGETTTTTTIITTTTSKVKCRHCARPARKDCTGSLCIRCCTDVHCTVHQDQRAKAQWKAQVLAGTTAIQQAAQLKRSRKLPKRRYGEHAFVYMNDTVVLWDLRTVLAPALPVVASSSSSSGTAGATGAAGALPGTAVASSSSSSHSTTASLAHYQNAVKLRDAILRKAGKNVYKRGLRSNRQQIRTVIDTLYHQSLGK